MTMKSPLAMAMALTLCSTPLLAADAPEAEIRALFAAHEAALNGHELEALVALYAPGDQTVVMGTTTAERWVGAEQIADAYTHFFADFDAGSVERECPWMQAEASGDVGWISANCVYQDSLKGTERQFALNVTAVVQRLDGDWKLSAMHFSNPTAPLAE
ncbi:MULTISPECIES: YybH family protein [Thiorhodovibrio]|uniref:YybH family protein n=1 Tax=Thiorhodovibrio TaxID=61593 RepID=UPI001911E962|nr:MULTISPECIES: nuclear transport factor 2 family protein [Thiorhodovibrio]MBK5967226.1 hypothetical protein [Thiorhodovibrio winogradskyi]WPL14883.1 hypothetical protein Thiosp_04739 [Thiorhodovibrio litoralis]